MKKTILIQNLSFIQVPVNQIYTYQSTANLTGGHDLCRFISFLLKLKRREILKSII
ncbi:hypothetical protein FHW89_004065 [Mucilaginibacter sp. SG564]|nr:hypothetical protein [Mucilaginibacter sp. SG564]